MGTLHAWKYPTLQKCFDSATAGSRVEFAAETWTQAGVLTIPSNVTIVGNGAEVKFSNAAGQWYVPDIASGAGAKHSGMIIDANDIANPDNPVIPGVKGGVVQYGSRAADYTAWATVRGEALQTTWGQGAKATIEDFIVRRASVAGSICFSTPNLQNSEIRGLRLSDCSGSDIGLLIDYGAKNVHCSPVWLSGPTIGCKISTQEGSQRTSKIVLDGGLTELGSYILLGDCEEIIIRHNQWNMSGAPAGVHCVLDGNRDSNNDGVGNGTVGPSNVTIEETGLARTGGTCIRVDTATEVHVRSCTLVGSTAYDLRHTSARIYHGRQFTQPSTLFSTTVALKQAEGVRFTEEIQVVATADLPVAASGMNGQILLEDAGTGNRNLIAYAGGERFRIDGGANV